MKKFKKIGNIIFYLIIGIVAAYAIFVLSEIDIAKPLDNNSTHIIKETTEDEGKRNTEKVIDEKYKEYVDGLVVSNIKNYTIPYDNIELFSQNNLFSNAYTKATVFCFVVENGNDLINHIHSVDILNEKVSLTPISRFYQLKNGNLFIITIVDNDKIDTINEKDNPLRIKLSVYDDRGNTYEKETNFNKKDYAFNKEKINAGEAFSLGENSFGIRLNTATPADAILRNDLIYNKMYYEFTTYMNVVTFGSDDKIEVDKLQLKYDLPDDLKDFDAIDINIIAIKELSHNEEEYNGENNLLCEKKIKIVCTFNDTKIDESVVKKYKDVIDNSSLILNEIEMPLKNKTTETTTEVIQK